MTKTNGLTLWNNGTWRPLTELRREMDRLFDDFWSATPTTRGASVADTAFVPACDVEEMDGHYLLTLEMPGVSKDDLKVEFLENQIVVSGERKHERRSKEEGAWYSERRYGKFQRSFGLPAGVDASKIEANYQDGLLRLMVPKAETAKPRQIKINHGGSAGLFGKFLGQPKNEREEVVPSSSPKAERIA